MAPAPVEDPLRNLPLLVALVLAGLEALLLVVAGVWSLVTMVQEGFTQVPLSIALALVLMLFALLLVVGMNALWKGRRWGRGPVLTWQLLQAAIALGVIGMSPAWVVYPAIGASVLVGVGLLLPASVAATSRPSSPSDTML